MMGMPSPICNQTRVTVQALTGYRHRAYGYQVRMKV